MLPRLPTTINMPWYWGSPRNVNCPLEYLIQIMVDSDWSLHFLFQVDPYNLCYCCPWGPFSQCNRASSCGYQCYSRAEMETGRCLLPVESVCEQEPKKKKKALTRQKNIVWDHKVAEIGGDVLTFISSKCTRKLYHLDVFWGTASVLWHTDKLWLLDLPVFSRSVLLTLGRA